MGDFLAARREDWYREAMTDACPGCNEPAEPHRWMRTGDRFLGYYVCGTCERAWTCGWHRSLVEGS